MGSCLRTVHHPLGYRRRKEQQAPSLYRGLSTTHRNRYLARLFQDSDFFRSEPTTGLSYIVSAQPNLATPSSVLLIRLTFSPWPDTSGGIYLLAIGSSEYSSS